MPVGDVNSNARGSGARYNDGKPRLDMIPPTIYKEIWPVGKDAEQVLEALGLLYEARHQEFKRAAGVFLKAYLKETIQVLEYGAKKYAEWNWSKGQPWSVPVASALRHLRAIELKEELDSESGLSHWGHVGCNLVFLMHFVDYYPEGNDLPWFALEDEADEWAGPDCYEEALAIRAGARGLKEPLL